MGGGEHNSGHKKGMSVRWGIGRFFAILAPPPKKKNLDTCVPCHGVTKSHSRC